MNTVTNEHYCRKIFSWKAVLAGSLFAFGMLLLFNLLTIGGGLATYVHTEQGLEKLIALAYLWTAVGSFIIMFIAGMVTSTTVYRDPYCTITAGQSILHGFLTWVVYILISLLFLSSFSESANIGVPRHFNTFSESTSMNTSSSNRVDPATTSSRNGTRATTTNNVNNVNAPTKQQAQTLGIATLASFFIFALEALGACFGAWFATDFCRRYCPSKTVYEYQSKP